MMPSSDTTSDTRKSTGSGHGAGKRKRGDLSPLRSTPSARASNSSMPSWKQPTTVHQLACQVSAAGTLLLNGKLNLEVARTYSSMMRATAQLVHSEIHRARMAENPPDLTLAEDVFNIVE